MKAIQCVEHGDVLLSDKCITVVSASVRALTRVKFDGKLL